jgi:predicted MFS family arabinose efflux permease
MLSFYFVLSWTPKLLVDAGLRPEEGISGGVLLNVGGIAGGLILGLLAARVGPFRMVSATMLAAALAVVAFGLVGRTLVPAMALALVVGYFLFGSMIGLYAIMPSVYPAGVRNTGGGMAIGVGRIGAILAPYGAGLLLQAGWAPTHTYVVFAAPLLVAAWATFALGGLRVSEEA